jgi:cyclopropane fatty-acyl-phospholipid synthase-like methyltransferase
MKYRESGMPSEELWDTFFTPREILEKMEVSKNIRNLLDIGCGYGTFLLPAAEIISGTVIGIDIDKEMIDYAKRSQKKIVS